ncbi:hypothetical protein HBI72_247950 [Parastagonospora nodorum]|nr:hypothetical protein HBI72_247950 [Parastagonospora nodorum]
MEVYDATAASRYDVTDVILREEVLPLNMAGELTYLDKLKRFDGVKGDMTRSGKVKYYEMFNDSCDDGDSDSDAKM